MDSKQRIIISEYLIISTIGGVGYGLLEIIWRGYTHWSMILTGGACFSLIYYISERFAGWSILKKAVAASIGVTLIEFLVGCVVNLLLGWQVWDYSKQPFSLLGQVCLGFFFLWFLLSFPAIKLSQQLSVRLFGHRSEA